MKSLYESILDRLEESILSSNNAGIVSAVKDNLKYCNNVKEFGKLWTKLGLDVDECHWGYASDGGYLYKNLNSNNIYCEFPTDPKKYPRMFIYIYNDPKKWPEKFDVEKYVKTVSKTLNMTYNYDEWGWYELKFK